MAALLYALPAVVLAGALMLLVKFDREVFYEPLVRDSSPTQNSGPIDAPSYTRSTIHFPAKDGTRLEAWLYRPKVCYATRPAPQLTDHSVCGANKPRSYATVTGEACVHQGVHRAPVVILGHGIGGQKDMALHAFADRFASNGLAAVIFDYRTFGGSDGEPRHWVSPKRHLEDWSSTIDYVQAPALPSCHSNCTAT